MCNAVKYVAKAKQLSGGQISGRQSSREQLSRDQLSRGQLSGRQLSCSRYNLLFLFIYFFYWRELDCKCLKGYLKPRLNELLKKKNSKKKKKTTTKKTTTNFCSGERSYFYNTSMFIFFR